jgi:hypothetical protein
MADRKELPTCGDCRHFDDGPPVGFCRRHPPALVAPADGDHPCGRWRWPVVDACDWCGEHQPRPPG